MGEPKSIIPFIAPKFNWKADNLYAHFQIFKDKVTFAFDGQFKEANMESKCGAILNWMGDEAFSYLSQLPDSVMLKRRILKHFWMDYWFISSLNRMFTSHGTLSDLSTVDNSSHKLIFTTNYSR